jgi:hypothetical protein
MHILFPNVVSELSLGFELQEIRWKRRWLRKNKVDEAFEADFIYVFDGNWHSCRCMGFALGEIVSDGIYSSRLMTWYPNFVLTGGEICPFWSSKEAVSNSLTIFPLVNVPRSPPFFPDGHCETSLAMFENFSPLFNRSNTVLASCSVLTRMWAQ